MAKISPKKLLLALTLLGVTALGAGFYLTTTEGVVVPAPPAPLLAGTADLPAPPEALAPIDAPIAENATGIPTPADPLQESPAATQPAAPPVVLTVAQALPTFESEKTAGALTYGTTKALADAYVVEQNQASAIETYDVYIATKPDDVSAIFERAKLLNEVGRVDEFKTSIVKIVELEPTELRLIELSGYLNSKQLYAEQLSVLKKLNEITQRQKPEHLLALVDVALAAKDYEVASQGLTDYSALPGAVVDANRAKQHTEILVLSNRADDALALATSWSKSQADGANNAALAGALLYQGAPAQAVKFIEASAPEGTDIPTDLKKIYAEALIATGEHAKALPILKEIRASAVNGEYEEAYFIALANAAKKDKALSGELRSLVKEQFDSGKLNDEQKIDRVYAIVNSGDKVTAIDYAERGMQASSEEFKQKWAQLYKSLTAPAPRPVASKKSARSLTKASSPSVSLDKRISLATRPGMSDSFVRAAAFDALNKGRKQDAVKLFAQLAVKNGPKSQDTQQLMYILGARIGQQEMAWLTSAANQSKGEAKAGWIEIIANYAPAEGIVAAGEVNPSWLSVPAFQRRYVSALTQLGQSSVSKSASAQPDNSSKRAQITKAEIGFQTAKYSEAEIALNSALSAPSDAANAVDAAKENVSINYYKAQLARRAGNDDEANNYFASALRDAGDHGFDDRSTQVKIFSSQMALGMTDKASRGFETLLQHSPDDEALLADYLAALLDKKMYSEAKAVASKYGSAISAMANSNTAPNTSAIKSVSGSISVPTAALSQIQPMAAGKELRLQFNQPLPNGFAPEGVASKPSWLAYYTTSYDSMVLAAVPGYTLRSTPADQAVMISAVADAATPVVSDDEAQRQRYLRLQLLYARLELETGATDEALNRLNALDSEYSNTSEYKAYLANAEYYALNPIRALSLVKDAQRLSPMNEDIKKLRRNIERFHANHLKLDHEWYKLGPHHQQISTVEVRSAFDNDLEVTARLQNNHIDTGFIRRTSGELLEFSGNRQRAEIEIAKSMSDSSIVAGKLYGNRDSAGAGVSYQFINPLGTSGAYVDYHKPYWDLPEAVVADATRDRAAIYHWFRPNTDWTIRVEGAYNRYNVDNKTNIVESGGAQVNILRTIAPVQPYVALSYGFDGEYLFGNDVARKQYLGNTYKYLPLRAREVHSLSAIVYHEFEADTNGELNLGYAYDRLGENGPFVEGRLTHFVADDMDVQLRGRYGFTSSAGEDNTATVGGYARWTW